MKPDGVATAALEPMEALESEPVNEAAPAAAPEPNQAASPAEEEVPQKPAGGTGQEEPEKAKETPAAKAGNKTSGDPKAKTANKPTAKTKAGTANPARTTPGSKTNTPQSRLSNGVSKPQTNGVAKKSTTPADKKSTTTSALSKKPTGTAGAAAAAARSTAAKVGEKKATGTAATGAKPTAGTAAAKKTTSTTANAVKSSATAAAAKKPPAPKTTSGTSTKPGSVASPKPDKTPVSKATRPSTGTTASTRPATASTRPASASTAKSSTAAAKPAAPKTPSAAKAAAAKPAATTPSAGRAPPSQAPRNATPVKKDVTKPAARKPADSPLSRPSSTTKGAKPETPKSASKAEVSAKKPPSKPADTKTANRSKPQESKAPASKTPVSKAKASSPKKTVGSSTPTPVKRGPKGAAPEEVAAVVATAAAIASAAAVVAGAGEPELPAEGAVRTSAPSVEAAPEPVLPPVQPTPEPPREPTPEPPREPTPVPPREPTPEPPREPTPEPPREPTPEPMRVPTPEPPRVPTPEPMRVPTPEPPRVPTPEPMRVPTPEPPREPTPEPPREPTPEPMRVPTPELPRELTPEPPREPTPEPMRVPTPEPVREMSPDPGVEVLSEASAESDQEPEAVPQPPSLVQMSAHMDPFRFETSVPSLGTTVMSPPCSPPGLASPVREPESAPCLLDMQAQSNLWDRNQAVDPSNPVDTLQYQEEQERDIYQHFGGVERRGEEEEEEEEEEENLLMPTCTVPVAFDIMAQPNFVGTSALEDFSPRGMISPRDQEEAVEKADQEINEDDEEEDDEDEEQRRLGHQPSSLITDMSTSQPSEEFQVRSSAGWHGDDFLSGMDSEDVSSCTSSRQQGVSDLSSAQHTAILEGTQSSDALVDTSLRGSEGDGNFMGSPNVETLANEEEDDEDDERVDDMDLSSERVEEPHKAYQGHEDEDEDVEMRSEGVTESCGNADEDDFNEGERLDNLNRAAPPAAAVSWGQANPFADTWAQPAPRLSGSSPSPVSDHGAAESETPTQCLAQAYLDSGAPSFAPSFALPSEQHLQDRRSPQEEVKEEGRGAAPAAHSSSETSTPEDLRDYDSSSGVESRSDKQQTPVPASVQPDLEQDLGIHLEKGDGEEEEAETLPADEVPGTGPPTAPASAPSSPSTSGDEASDTEGEMQINDPDAPMTMMMMMDESAGFDSPPPTRDLPALEEDEEAGDAPTGEEDGGGATPQSANSVASYGFDCTTSNSNAHSMAESCGKSPGIFSLENEEQLPEEAKDPSLIKELTLPSAAATTAAAHADDLLGRPVDLMPLGLPGDRHAGQGDQLYMLGGKMAAEQLEEAEPEGQQRGDDSQPPYYSTICDKTDSFLAGDTKTPDEGRGWQTRSRQDNQNQNQNQNLPASAAPIANGHYLALVPGNRRPIDPSLAAHFAHMAAPPPPPPPPPPPLGAEPGGEQLRRLEQHQEKLRELEQERQKRQWLEEERLRLEQQKQLEQQRRELLQLQLQQQQQEHRRRRQVLQWQLELEQQYRMQQQQQQRRSPTGVLLSPSSGLCTIYEAMETSDEEDDCRAPRNRNGPARRTPSPRDPQRPPLRPPPPRDLDWNRRVDMVQQLINQTLMLSGDGGGCGPLLLLPVGAGGTLSPLESSMWPGLLPHFSPPAAAATVTSVSSYSPDSRGSSPSGDWTVVEVETQH